MTEKYVVILLTDFEREKSFGPNIGGVQALATTGLDGVLHRHQGNLNEWGGKDTLA